MLLITLEWSGVGVGGRYSEGVREGFMVGHCLVLTAGRLFRLLSRGDGDLMSKGKCEFKFTTGSQ